MNKEDLLRMIKAESLSAEDLKLLDQMEKDYPWFGIPRFLKLKASLSLNKSIDPQEISKTVVYASDRKHLYEWLYKNTVSETGMEIEFLDDAALTAAESESFETPFELIGVEDDRMEMDADARGIPEKDESDMEEPEIEEIGPLPLLDHIESDPEKEKGEEKDVKNEVPYEKDPEPPHVDLLLRNTLPTDAESQPGNSNGLIERFLETDPGVIKADKQSSLEGDVSVQSIQEDDSFITDTLAKIYVKQGLHAKAIYAYERLSLKYPEKSAYFAAQIEKIKENTNS